MSFKKDILIINNCPAFYKINLYNEIAKHKEIFVVFLGLSDQVVAGIEFKQKIKFPYILLNEFQVEKRSFFRTLFAIANIILKMKPSKIIYGGYIEKELLLLSFFNSKSKNILQTETASETNLSGWKYWIKLILLSRYSKALVSGTIHATMLKKMKFNGQIVITKGVGFIEKTQIVNNVKQKNNPLRFLYIGRLIKLKNLNILIEVFNDLGLPLTIVGRGVLKNELESKAKSNIKFEGFIDNTRINNLYNQNDIFILPSLSEAWGLVVEEALYYGLPIIASNRVGSYPELVTDHNTGVTFDPLNKESLKNAIYMLINNFDYYKNNVDNFDFVKKDSIQLNAYISL